MSKIIIFTLVVTMAVAVLSAPAEHQFEDLESLQEVDPPTLKAEEVESPQARVTCDLLSGIGWAHTFCAAHCLALGYKGGSCNSKGVCECRN